MDMTEAQFRQLSLVFREALIEWHFKPVEIRLLLLLCSETFDLNHLVGQADTVRWALRLKLREDKLRKEQWREVCMLGVVDFNAGQGTYQLRPDMAHWTLRGPRGNDLRAGQEALPLVAHRPVSDAYSELSRENALALSKAKPDGSVQSRPAAGSQSSKDLGEEFKRLQAAISRGTVDIEFPNGSAANFSVTPLTENLAIPGGKIRRAPAEKSAGSDPPGNALLTKAAEKSAAPIAKLSLDPKANSFKAAEKSAAAWDWLRSIDRTGALGMAKCRGQWMRLCSVEPDYVLVKLAGALQRGLQLASIEGKEIEVPLAYMARKARGDKKLR